MKDHSESLQIEFDPSVTSYEKIVNIFWNSHNPTTSSHSRQYMCALFYHNEDQQKIALKTKAKMESSLKKEIKTSIVLAGEFYDGEDYHQKYMLRRNSKLMEPYKNLPLKEFIHSSPASRLNGYIGGNGSAEALEKEIKSFHLKPDQEEEIYEIVGVKKKKGLLGSIFK